VQILHAAFFILRKETIKPATAAMQIWDIASAFIYILESGFFCYNRRIEEVY